MTVWIGHGFNVLDAGKGSVDKLHPYIEDSEDFDYGYTELFMLPCVNRRAVRSLLEVIKPGDSIVAHSNGCLIAWQIAQVVPLSSVVCINPALRRDTRWPDGMPVLCLHNSTDWVVQLGRVWGRLTDWDGIRAAGWGAAGRYGFTSGQETVSNWDTADVSLWEYPTEGHSGIFAFPEYWGSIIGRWIEAVR